MQLEEFYQYKNQLMSDLLTDENIVRLIDDTVPIDKAYTLAYKNVFPYEYVPDTIEEAKTFICFDVDIQEAPTKTFLYPTLHIWVFSHKTLLRLKEGGVLVDKIVSEIAKKINGSRFYGLGELDLKNVRRFTPLTDYQGKSMTFDAKDWNRPGPRDVAVPANRKRA